VSGLSRRAAISQEPSLAPESIQTLQGQVRPWRSQAVASIFSIALTFIAYAASAAGVLVCPLSNQ